MKDAPGTDSANVVPAAERPGASNSSTDRGIWTLWRIIDICAGLFWLYVVTKLFVFDIDALLLHTFFPDAAWLWDLRIVFS
jgi:hypothetical protein